MRNDGSRCIKLFDSDLLNKTPGKLIDFATFYLVDVAPRCFS